MGATRLTPIFTADDLEKSVAWYRDVLGWEVGETFEEEGELLTEPEDQPWGGRMFAVADPDGFKVSISTPVKDEK